jgi:hypothetical protein
VQIKKKNLTDYKEISKEWNFEKNKLDIKIITRGSSRSIWWKCAKGHEWKASPYSRISKKTNCPFCSNRAVNSENNLNKLFPHIAKEWHPKKNGKLIPSQIVAGSNKRVWWKCKNGHEWRTNPAARTGKRKSGCPRCSRRISSFELRLLSELGGLFKNVTPIYKINNIEIDIFLNDHKIGIEYDGWYYHQKRLNNDKLKNKLLTRHNINLIRFRENPLPKISDYDIMIKQNKLSKKDLNTLLNKILSISNFKNIKIDKYLKKNKFQFEKEYQKYLSFYPAPIPQKSLKITNPKLVKEWDFKKNYPLKPENFYTNSGSRAWWKCRKGHSWRVRIADRTGNDKRGCPFCRGKRIDDGNSLETLFPKVAHEFHKTKNGKLKPKNLSPGSHKKYWWKCKKGHEWKAIIKSRTEQKTGCPYCSGNLASRETNLKRLFPNLMKEWHPSKNKNIDPSKLRPGSNLDVWWKCNKGHTWLATISRRTSTNSKCVYCANLKVSKTNNLQAISKKISKEWHPTKNYPTRPKDIIAKTGKIYWWKCSKGHEWKQSPAMRFNRGCPYCGKHYITKEKSLSYKFPELAKEWHPTKNKDITPENTHARSNKKVWWKCESGHVFSVRVNSRIQRNKITRCNICRLNK